jgi:hypothetical protein
MLRAGVTAIARRGEEAVVTASGLPGMIVTILNRRVGTMLVTLLVMVRLGMIVAMFGRVIVVVIIMPILRVYGRWADSGQRKCNDGQGG